MFTSTPINAHTNRQLRSSSSSINKININNQLLSPVKEKKRLFDDDKNESKENAKQASLKNCKSIVKQPVVVLTPLKEYSNSNENQPKSPEIQQIECKDPLKRLFLNNNLKDNNKDNKLQIRIAEIKSCVNENEHLEFFSNASTEVRVMRRTTTTTTTTTTRKIVSPKNDVLAEFMKKAIKAPPVKRTNDENLIIVKKSKNSSNDLLKNFLLENDKKKKRII